jgi:hypothetical protein
VTRTQHVARVVRTLPVELREALRRAPLTAMTGTGLIVRSVPTLTSGRGTGGMCDGMSFSEHDTVLYAPTESRRQNFTLLHEYAHLLVDNDEEALIWVADQNEPALELERLCDHIAADLLVPDHVLDQIVSEGPITGQHLIDLYRNTEASQIVCAIALSRRLGCTGAIMLTDRATQKVVHASLVGEPSVYPSKNQAVPSSHPLLRISPGEQVCRESFWATPWGTRNPYYLNAAATEKRTYSVLADLDLWNAEQLHLPVAEYAPDRRPRAGVTCACGFKGPVTGWPCPDCNKQFCRRCKSCDCDRRAALTERCSECFLSIPRIDLEAGICSGCR